MTVGTDRRTIATAALMAPVAPATVGERTKGRREAVCGIEDETKLASGMKSITKLRHLPFICVTCIPPRKPNAVPSWVGVI